jgi:hypothetical protein
MFDRSIGYVIFCVFCLAVMALLSYFLWPAFYPQKTRIIAFDAVGNLRIDDPVRVKGILAGKIKRIDWRKDNVFVCVSLKKPVMFYRGYSIADIDQGIMGDRMLMIDCGDTSGPSVAEGDTLKGVFHPGVSEAVGYMWKLHATVDSFVAISSQLLHGTAARKSIIEQTDAIISTVDSLSRTVLNLSEKLERNITRQLDSIDAMVNTAARLSQAAAASAPEYLSMLESQIKKTSRLLATLDTASEKLIRFSASLERQDNILWKNHVALLQERLATLQKAIAVIQMRMLQFKTHLGLF